MLAKIFILIVRLSPGFQKAMWKWWYQRLARRGHNTGWSFMNYGYTPSNGTYLELKKEDENIVLLVAPKNQINSNNEDLFALSGISNS